MRDLKQEEIVGKRICQGKKIEQIGGGESNRSSIIRVGIKVLIKSKGTEQKELKEKNNYSVQSLF